MNKSEVSITYAWPSLEDYVKDVGFPVNEAFKIGWRMARTTNAMLGIKDDRSPLNEGQVCVDRAGLKS